MVELWKQTREYTIMSSVPRYLRTPHALGIGPYARRLVHLPACAASSEFDCDTPSVAVVAESSRLVRARAWPRAGTRQRSSPLPLASLRTRPATQALGAPLALRWSSLRPLCRRRTWSLSDQHLAPQRR